MARIEVIRHVNFEDLGILTPLFEQRGDCVCYHEAMDTDFNQERLQQADLLIVLGAPIGAFDEQCYPFLQAEIACIQKRIQAGQAILGICLGAQLIARILGAEVAPMQTKEIGYAPLILTEAGKTSVLKYLANIPVLHWHGDQFTLPANTEQLAWTPLCSQQAFALGRHILALQFHLEADASKIEYWLVGHACELTTANIDPNVIRTDALHYGKQLSQSAWQCMNEWLDQALIK